MIELPDIKIVLLISDEKLGRVYGIQTGREFLEIRVTPSGLIRLENEVQKGQAAWASLDDPKKP